MDFVSPGAARSCDSGVRWPQRPERRSKKVSEYTNEAQYSADSYPHTGKGECCIPLSLFICSNCGSELSDADVTDKLNAVRCKTCGAVNQFYCFGAGSR